MKGIYLGILLHLITNSCTAQGNLFPFKYDHKLSDFGLKGNVRQCTYLSEAGAQLFFDEKGLLQESARYWSWSENIPTRKLFFYNDRDSLVAVVDSFGGRETGRRDFLHNDEGRHIESYSIGSGEKKRTDSLAYNSAGNLTTLYRYSNEKPDDKIEYCYDDCNRLTGIYVFDDSGYIMWKQFIRYMDDEKIGEELTLGFEDRFHERIVYSCPGGFIEKIDFAYVGSEIYTTNYRVDAHGNWIEQSTSMDDQGYYNRAVEYVYDKEGNWIWRKSSFTFLGKGECRDIFREIIYY